jgi:hypothetical protein
MEMHEIYKKNRIVETSELKLTGSNLYQIIESCSHEIVMQEIATSVVDGKEIPYLYDNRPVLTGSKVILSLDEYVPRHELFQTKVNHKPNGRRQKYVISQIYSGEFHEEFSKEYMKENNLATRIKDREEIH